MRFQYQYKLSGGERRAGICDAPSKDAVFSLLKKEGIKPFDVKLAPGVFNRIRSFGKRGLAIAVLAVLCAVLAVAVGRRTSTPSGAVALADSLDSALRRQLIGDSAIIDQGIRTGWADVFSLEGDRFLASFAIPGASPAIRSTTEEKLKEALSANTASGASLRQDVGESLESRQIVAIVAGMKSELRQFVADGGSFVQYGRLLVQRQEQEIAYYNRAKNEIDVVAEKGDVVELKALWKRRNGELKRMGIRTVLLPTKKN